MAGAEPGADGAQNDSPKVRFPPPLVFAGFVLLGLLADDLFGLNPAIPDAIRWLGGALVLAGLGIAAVALGLFRKAGTDPEPWKASSALVVGGLYRFTRNPMYLGMALAHLGLAMALDSMGALLLLPLAVLAIHTQVIAREEAYLAARFGPDYKEYRRHVRRWL